MSPLGNRVSRSHDSMGSLFPHQPPLTTVPCRNGVAIFVVRPEQSDAVTPSRRPPEWSLPSATIWKMTEGVGSSRLRAFPERFRMDAVNRSLSTIIPTNYLVWIGEWKLSWIVQQLG